MLAAPHGSFGDCDFWQRAAEVDGSSALAGWRSPGDGAVQRQVELEDAGTIAVMLQFTLVARRQARSRYAQQLPGSDVAQHSAGRWQHIKRFNLRVCDDFPSQ